MQTEKRTKLTMWTHVYRPFILGGSCNYILGTEIEEYEGPFDLGKGFTGFLVTTPSGATRVIESTSGGIVGDTLNEVRADISTTPSKQAMQRQVDQAIAISKKVEKVDLSAFWAAMQLS